MFFEPHKPWSNLMKVARWTLRWVHENTVLINRDFKYGFTILSTAFVWLNNAFLWSNWVKLRFLVRVEHVINSILIMRHCCNSPERVMWERVKGVKNSRFCGIFYILFFHLLFNKPGLLWIFFQGSVEFFIFIFFYFLLSKPGLLWIFFSYIFRLTFCTEFSYFSHLHFCVLIFIILT